MKFLFVHSWQGFSLAEWYLREAIISRCNCNAQFRSVDVPGNGIPANDILPGTIFSWMPDVIGFSCHYWNISYFLTASIWIKQQNPEMIIVLGGPQVRSFKHAETLLNDHQSIDFIIHGAGEEPLSKLLDSLDQKKSLESIPGLSYRESNKVIHSKIVNKQDWQRSLIFHKGNYQLNRTMPALQEVSYETIKGCRSECIYCYYAIDKYQSLNDEQILAELTFICNSKIKNLRICDTHFGGTKERAKKILHHLSRVNHHTSVKIYPDLNHIDKAYVKLIKVSGAQITSIGIQSTNSTVLKLIKRKELHRETNAISLILSEFPDVPADLIVGLPGDNLQGLEQSFRDVIDLGFSEVNLFRIMIFPGTTISENLSAYYELENLVLSDQGQLISSYNFPALIQSKLSNLMVAMKIASHLSATKNKLCQSGLKASNVLDILLDLNSDQLLEMIDNLSSMGGTKMIHEDEELNLILNSVTNKWPQIHNELDADFKIV